MDTKPLSPAEADTEAAVTYALNEIMRSPAGHALLQAVPDTCEWVEVMARWRRPAEHAEPGYECGLKRIVFPRSLLAK